MKKHGKIPSCCIEMRPWLKDVQIDESKYRLHVPDNLFIDVTVTLCVAVAAKNVWQHRRVLLDNQDM